MELLYPKQIIKSLNPYSLYDFKICHKIGFPPISIIDLGLVSVSSLNLVPKPPASMTTFIFAMNINLNSKLYFNYANLLLKLICKIAAVRVYEIQMHICDLLILSKKS